MMSAPFEILAITVIMENTDPLVSGNHRINSLISDGKPTLVLLLT